MESYKTQLEMETTLESPTAATEESTQGYLRPLKREWNGTEQKYRTEPRVPKRRIDCIWTFKFGSLCVRVREK